MPKQTPHRRKSATKDSLTPVTIPLAIWRKARQKHTYFKFIPYQALGEEKSRAERDRIIDSILELSGQDDPLACIPRTARDDAKGNCARDCSARFLRIIEKCVSETRHRAELSDLRGRNSISPKLAPFNGLEQKADHTSSGQQLGGPTTYTTFEAKFEDEVRESSGRKRGAAKSAKARLAAYGSYNSSNKQIDTDDDYTEGEEDDNDNDEIQVQQRSRTSCVAEHDQDSDPTSPVALPTAHSAPQQTLFITPPPTSTTTPSVCLSELDATSRTPLNEADLVRRKRMLDIEDMELEKRQIQLRRELKAARRAEELEDEEERNRHRARERSLVD